jgi:hypothetical protein
VDLAVRGTRFCGAAGFALKTLGGGSSVGLGLALKRRLRQGATDGKIGLVCQDYFPVGGYESIESAFSN